MWKRRRLSVAAVVLALALSAATASAAVRTATFRIKGMTCADCAVSIEKALKATEGVLEARVSYEKERAWIRYDAGKVSRSRLRKVIEEAGFQVVAGANGEAGQGPEDARPSARPDTRAR